MTFPTIPTAGAGRLLSNTNTNPAGTHTSPSLSSLTKNSGDLLIAIVIIYDGNSTNAEFSSWGGGFTEFKDAAGTATMGIGCAYKFSDGTETGTFTVTSADASANDSAFFLLSIPGAHASTVPEAGTMATGTAPDAGSLNPAGWGTEDTLWIAVGASGEDATTGSYTGIGTAPTNYSSQADSGISADAVGGVEGSVAFRQLNAASEDPGTWSMDTSNARGAALLIAVRPAAAAPLTAGQGSFTLTGQSVNLLQGHKVAADQGSFALNGQSAILARGYPITAAQGSFTFTGQAVHLQWSKQAGYYIVEGGSGDRLITEASDALVTENFIIPLTAASGSFALNGQNVNLLWKHLVTAGQGSFALNGQSVNFDRGMPAAFGSFAFTGQDVNLLQGYKVQADQGSFTLTGQNANLLWKHQMAAAQGSFLLNGQNVVLSRGYKIAAGQGSYALNGQTVNLRQDRRVVAAQGSFLLNGQAATFGVKFPADFGSFTFTGQAANFVRGRTITAGQGSFALNGQNAALRQDRRVVAAQGSFLLNGQAVSFVRPGRLSADQGSFLLNGQNANLLWKHQVAAAQGSFLLNGQDVTFTYSPAAGGSDVPMYFGKLVNPGQLTSRRVA